MTKNTEVIESLGFEILSQDNNKLSARKSINGIEYSLFLWDNKWLTILPQPSKKFHPTVRGLMIDNVELLKGVINYVLSSVELFPQDQKEMSL